MILAQKKRHKIPLACKIWEMIVFCLNDWVFICLVQQQKIWFLCANRSEFVHSLTRQLTYPSIDNNQHNLLMHTMMEWWMIPYHLTWNGPLVWKSVKKNCLLQSDRVRNMKMYYIVLFCFDFHSAHNIIKKTKHM